MNSRDVPAPTFASGAARAVLAGPSASYPAWPELTDTDGWRRIAQQLNSAKAASTTTLRNVLPVDTNHVNLGGVSTFVARPRGDNFKDRRHIILSFHGGALAFFGGDENVEFEAAVRAFMTGCATYSVDYRVPPDHPYPAALDDAVSAYRALLKDHAPEEVIVLGDAGGAALAAALLMRIRDEKIPMAGGAVLLTPELDLTESGDTFSSLMGLDKGFTTSLLPVSRLYAGSTDLHTPYISPIFGDMSKFPPTFLQSGTRDVLLSSAVVMHRKLRLAGIRAELNIWEAMPHGGFGGLTPEDREISKEVQAFIASL